MMNSSSQNSSLQSRKNPTSRRTQVISWSYPGHIRFILSPCSRYCTRTSTSTVRVSALHPNLVQYSYEYLSGLYSYEYLSTLVAVPFILYLVRFCSPKPCKYLYEYSYVYFVFSTFLLFQIL